jgi:NAD-dependent SIR2 family protein deacetylase
LEADSLLTTHSRRRNFDYSHAMNPEIQTIVILTGAGISAESGLATFRGPDGLWEGHRVEDVSLIGTAL